MAAFNKLLDNGTEVAPLRRTLNVVGATIADDSTNDRTNLTFQTGDITGITAGNGLTGGGASGAVTLDVGAGTGILANANDVALDTAHARNADHSAISVTAGSGLTGGGDITATRTLDVGAGTGVTVNANDVAVAESYLRQQSTVLTNAQVLALRATPITVVAAPGAGKWCEFVSASLLFNRTAGYTETADNFVIRYVNSAGTVASATIETTGFVDAAGDAITLVGPAATPPILTAAGELSNAVMVIHNSGDGELGAGDAANTITVVVTYRIHTTAF